MFSNVMALVTESLYNTAGHFIVLKPVGWKEICSKAMSNFYVVRVAASMGKPIGSNMSNFITFPNTEKAVENTTRSGAVFLTKF